MSWKHRNPATVAEHVAIGAAIQDAEDAVHALLSYSRHFNANESKRLCMTLDSLSRLKSRMEGAMLQEHPHLPWPQASAVYYRSGDENAVEYVRYILDEYGDQPDEGAL